MSAGNVKQIRGQVRQVVKDIFQEVVNKELLANIEKAAIDNVSVVMNGRLDRVEKFCQENLTAQDKRAQSILGFILGEVRTNIANEIHDQRLELTAIRELLFEMANITISPEVLTAKKNEVQVRLNEEAKAKQQEAIQAAEAEKKNAEARTETTGDADAQQPTETEQKSA